MNSAIVIWQLVRAVRWLSWLGFLGYSLHYVLYPQVHLNSFGHLLPKTELAMFGFGILAIFAGLIELMLRERAGLARPSFGQWMPPRATAALKPTR
jgi:hypothetical protein